MPKLWNRCSGLHVGTSPTTILCVLPRFCDMHLHLRQDVLPEQGRINFLAFLSATSGEYCTDILAMTNTLPWVSSVPQWREYTRHVEEALTFFPHCRPIIVMMVSQDTTPDLIDAACAAGVTDFKAMPAGQTTHSANGIHDYRAMLPVWQAIARRKARLHLHGEMPGRHISPWCRVERFVQDVLWWLRTTCRDLDMIVEHITKKAEIDFIREAQKFGPGRTFGTVTIQHAEKDANDLLADKCVTDLFCKPLFGGPADQEAIFIEVTNGAPYLGIGSDSAAHPWWTKHTGECCAGVFSAPVLPARILMLWEKRYGAVEILSEQQKEIFWRTLVDFTSGNAVRFFALAEPKIPRPVHLIKEPWKTPTSYFGGLLVPYGAGEMCTWRMLSQCEIAHN